MRYLNHLPRLVRWILGTLCLFMFLMTMYRLLFFVHYNDTNESFSGRVFLLGLRYDARVVSIMGLILMLLSAIPLFHPFKNQGSQKWWSFFIGLLVFIFLFFYGADFYHYDYLKQRLNYSVLNYTEDAGISSKMVWQTYPIIRITLFFCLALFLFIIWHKRFIKSVSSKVNAIQKSKFNTFSHVIFIAMLVGFVFGRVGQYPLRWSDAFVFTDNFKANAALNPFQSFFSSMDFTNKSFDIKKVKNAYPEIANYLGVTHPDSSNLNFERLVSFSDTTSAKPNIVLVICESFSAYKSSMFGNQLNPTPYFNSMCNNGVFFERCFTPAFGTARGVWATVTGIPDVSITKTSSRNPSAVDQHSIINDFNAHNKLYFLGGSATWANIRGLLSNNIDHLKIYEEDDFQSSKVDVWGISDKNLFLQANKVLATQSKPFFAIIQTADNHRPYTIPAEDLIEFNKVNYSADTLKKYGFENNEQLNAFRYTDFNFKKFIEAAKKEKYFSNTIFVFVGDHGLRGDAGDLFPQSFSKQGILAEHVPLLFYSPTLLKPKKVRAVCSQLDILPSIATLAKQSYSNTAFGRNLFDSTNTQKRYAFIADPDIPSIGLVSDEYYYVRNLKTKSKQFVSVINNNPVLSNAINDSIKNNMSRLTEYWYQTAQYMLLNNKKRKP